MPRMARLVIPDHPHHVTQRGNRRQKTFFGDDDYLEYLKLLRENQPKANVEIWAYCLMPNHVHLVAVPTQPDGLSKLLRVTHHRYARRVNSRYGWRGHLWQERFYSFVMDEPHLLAAVRYVELNPVRAGLCARAEQWRWSSVHANMDGRTDPIVNTAPMNALVSDWAAYLSRSDSGPTIDDIRRHTANGQPAGDKTFVSAMEALSGRRLHRLKPGPKPRN